MSIATEYLLEEERRRKALQDAQKQQGAVSPSSGGIVPAGAIESRTANYINSLNQQKQQGATSQPQQQAQPQQDYDYSRKPEGWGDDEYRAIKQIYSDDQIQQSLSNPDPNSFLDGIYTNMFQENVPAPVEPDEKQMKRQRAIAGIGDVLSLVSQAASGAMGARNKERTFDQSAYGQLTKKQEEILEKYKQETDRYGREMVNMQMKDYLSGMQDWKQTQANIGKSLNDYRKYQVDVAKQNQDAAYKAFQADNTARRTSAYEKSLDAQIEDRRRRTGIAATNAANSTARTKAYIEKMKSGGTTTTAGTKADYQLVLPAVDGDTNATQDQFGNPVRIFGMSNGEMDQYARQALADKAFMAQHPEFNTAFGIKHTADDKKNIAAAYLQELYASQFAPQQVDATIGAGNQFSGQIPEIMQGSTAEEEVEPPFDPALDDTELDEMFQVVY